MKQNRPSESSFQNRVAQFEQEERIRRDAEHVRKQAGVSDKIKALDSTNPYLQARLKVLNSYGKELLAQIHECERTGNLKSRAYDRFIFDILIAAGDVPTHELRKKTEECGCHSCKGRKSK